MYSINNILFSNFGIIPGRVDGSNIAVSGMLDMPERIGKSFHDWTGDAGIEPYVLQPEIRHGGRSINFAGYVVGADKASAYAALNLFYKELNSYDDLVTWLRLTARIRYISRKKQKPFPCNRDGLGLEFNLRNLSPQPPKGEFLWEWKWQGHMLTACRLRVWGCFSRRLKAI